MLHKNKTAQTCEIRIEVVYLQHRIIFKFMEMNKKESGRLSTNKKGNHYDVRISAAITWLRFPLIFFIILLHCYSVQHLVGDHKTYFNLLYPLTLWIGETGVPGFFFISGYLFFLSKKKYTQKLLDRVRSLLVPYLLWNTILLVLYVIAQIIGYPQDINGRSLADYNYIDYLRLYWDRGSYDHGNFAPLLCPLWYIRNLLIMSILSPLLLYIIRFAREAFLLAIAAWWLMTYNNAFIPQTVLFFCLGAYFSILNINPLKIVDKNKGLFITLFAVLAICDIVSHTVYGTPLNLQIHRLSLIFNIAALIILADHCVQHHYTNKTLSNAAFIVFCIHYPIVVILRKSCIAHFTFVSDTIHILLYFACIIISTLISIGFYLILDNYFPNIKRTLSGNR